jgi:isopenicillin N synthase-like dioxygenase
MPCPSPILYHVACLNNCVTCLVQVQASHGEWVDVPAGEGVLAVIPGYTLCHLTAGALGPATHRVVRLLPLTLQNNTLPSFNHAHPCL